MKILIEESTLRQWRDALEEMKAEFRALDLPYGSKAYTKANNATHEMQSHLDAAVEFVR